jgi:acetaldehyde dehydrogenase
MTEGERVKVAIIGTGNIGTDLMVKVVTLSTILELVAFVGIDPASDGLAKAAARGIDTVSDGVDGLIRHPRFAEIEVVFDATSARAHLDNWAALEPHGKMMIDLTPAAIGPFVVPVVNGQQHLGSANVNMVTCGGQATIPIVAAVSRSTPVHYAEIVASISSRSAGPGTRANIDEFTETTRTAIEQLGRAARAKAIIVLNPAEPPLVMRDTVYCLTDRLDAATRASITHSVRETVDAVADYVPGYRLKQQVQFDDLEPGTPVRTLANSGLEVDASTGLTKVSVFLEVEGAAHYLPKYAGNLDIMTSAAVRTAEAAAEHLLAGTRS